MNGIEAAGKIREREVEGKHTPIVALTAYALKGDRERFLKLGMDDYLAKPVNMESLFETVDRLLALRGAEFNVKGFRLDDEGNIVLIENWTDELSDISSFQIDEIEVYIRQINHSLQNLDYILTERLAHTLKNLCNTIGADELKNSAFQVELAIRRSCPESAAKSIKVFEQEFNTFKNLCIAERK